MNSRGSALIAAVLALTLMLAAAMLLSRALVLRLQRQSNAFRAEAAVVVAENALEQARVAWLKDAPPVDRTQQIAGAQVGCTTANGRVRLEGVAPVRAVGLPPGLSRAVRVTWEFQRGSQTGVWQRRDWQRRIETMSK